jgi:hypothetical protein
MSRSRILGFWAASILALAASPPGAEPGDGRPRIGTRVENLEFKDIRFLSRTLDDFSPKTASDEDLNLSIDRATGAVLERPVESRRAPEAD